MLVTLAEMKAYLGIDSGDTSQDAFLTTQIQIMSNAIELYCKRKFLQATYTQTFYGSLRQRIQLAAYPVQSITSINAYDAFDDVAPEAWTPGQDFLLNKAAGIVMANCGAPCGYYSTTFIYVAGYAVADVPMVLKGAIFSLVQTRYNSKAAGVDLNFGSNVQSVSIPGALTIAYDYGQDNASASETFGAILGDQLNVINMFKSEKAILGSSELTFVESV